MAQELKGQEYLKAKATKIGISETKAGKPQITIEFTDEKGRAWIKHNSLNEGKAREFTMDTLQVLEFNGKLSDLAMGKGISFDKEIQITIDDVPNEDKSKYYRQVTWVNDLNKGAKLLAEADALMKLSGMNLEADFALKFGGAQATAKGANPTDQDLPF